MNAKTKWMAIILAAACPLAMMSQETVNTSGPAVIGKTDCGSDTKRGERLRKLKETDPQKFEQLQAKLKDKMGKEGLGAKMKILKEKDPQAFERIRKELDKIRAEIDAAIAAKGGAAANATTPTANPK